MQLGKGNWVDHTFIIIIFQEEEILALNYNYREFTNVKDYNNSNIK